MSRTLNWATALLVALAVVLVLTFATLATSMVFGPTLVPAVLRDPLGFLAAVPLALATVPPVVGIVGEQSSDPAPAAADSSASPAAKSARRGAKTTAMEPSTPSASASTVTATDAIPPALVPSVDLTTLPLDELVTLFPHSHQPESTEPPAPVPCRVLADCIHGVPNDLAHLLPDDLVLAKRDGLVDDSPAAVAYARSLRAA